MIVGSKDAHLTTWRDIGAMHRASCRANTLLVRLARHHLLTPKNLNLAIIQAHLQA
jgi:hypothetical protein